MTTIVRRAAALAIVMGMAGCGTPSESKAPSAGSYESETEYRKGLSQTLEVAPTAYAGEVLTRSYNLGYATGRLEGTEYRMKGSDEDLEMGCTAISPALLEAAGAQFRGIDLCKSMKRTQYAHAAVPGARFEQARLTIVRMGVQANDRRITEMVVTAYENGYAMGALRSADEGDPLGEKRTAVAAGCERHIGAYFDSSVLFKQCGVIAGDVVATYVEALRHVREERAARAR